MLRDRDLRAAWRLTHPDLRRQLVSAWVEANKNHPHLRPRDYAELTVRLAEVDSSDPLWDGYAMTQLREFGERWSHIDLKTWGWGTDPRPLAPDRELAILVDVEGEYGVLERDAALPGLGFVMQLTEGRWLVVDFDFGELAGGD